MTKTSHLKGFVLSLMIAAMAFASVQHVQAGSQPGIGIVIYNLDERIADGKATLRKAKTTLAESLAKSKSLLEKAKGTTDLAKKLAYLKESVDLLTKAAKLRQQIEQLEASLKSWGIAKQVYENQLAVAKLEAERLQTEELAKAQTELAATFEGPIEPTAEERVDQSVSYTIGGFCTDATGSSCSSTMFDLLTDGVKDWIVSEIDGPAQEVFGMLFSNPGAILSDTARLRQFEESLGDAQFMSELRDKLAQKFAAGMAVDAAKALAQAILIEQSAKLLERENKPELAEAVRLSAGPAISIAKLIMSVSKGTVGGPAAAAVSVWTDNTIKFVALGIDLAKAERQGTDIGTQIADLSNLQNSYVETIITGRMTGSGFPADRQNDVVSPELRAVLLSNLSKMPEISESLAYSANYQKWLQDSAKFVGEFFLPIVDALEKVGPENLGTGPAWLQGQ